MPKLSEFLQKQQATVHSVENAKKQEMWLAAVDTLLKQLRTWLADVEANQISITEETTGAYTVPALTLTVPNTGKKVRVIPIGRTIIGADGRVDLKSSKGKYVLLYLAEQKKWVHGVGGHPDDFPVLNEELFTDLFTRALE
jgi:hypothetical protein